MVEKAKLNIYEEHEENVLKTLSSVGITPAKIKNSIRINEIKMIPLQRLGTFDGSKLKKVFLVVFLICILSPFSNCKTM